MVIGLGLALFYAYFILSHAFYFIFLKSIPKYSPNLNGVSILVSARNEAQNLPTLLNHLFAQKGLNLPYEILILDDHSEDDTTSVLAPFLSKIKYLKLPDDIWGKKQALTYGIQYAQYELIVTTDADCTMGEHWLSTLVHHFEDSIQLLSAPVCLTAHSVWEEMQQVEFAGLIAIGAGAIAKQKPNLCNGANLAYRKSAFNAVKGYQSVDTLVSGDDEFLLHKIHQQFPKGVAFCKNIKACVHTPAQPSLKSFLQQRKRWTSKTRAYQRKGLTLQLLFIYLFYVSLVGIGILSFTSPSYLFAFLAMLGLKICAEAVILTSVLHFFNQLKYLKWFLMEQLLQIPYTLWAGLAGLKQNFVWKGRTYH